MIEEWDKLWDRKTIMPSWVTRMIGTDENTGKWIIQVKAEGDKLQEKAWNWDRNAEAFNEANRRLNEERLMLLKKLEDVKENLKTWDDSHKAWQMGRQKLLKGKLDGILEGVE